MAERRERLAATAEKYWGEKLSKWAYEADPKNYWKCNICVHDILEEAGIGRKSRYSAGTWGNPVVKIPGWEVVTSGTPQRGYIAACSQICNNSECVDKAGVMIDKTIQCPGC